MTTYGGKVNSTAPDAAATADPEWNTPAIPRRTLYYKGNDPRPGDVGRHGKGGW
jgi:hypothetical protein